MFGWKIGDNYFSLKNFYICFNKIVGKTIKEIEIDFEIKLKLKLYIKFFKEESEICLKNKALIINIFGVLFKIYYTEWLFS